MFQIDLQWLTFNVSLPAVEAWVKANTNSGYVGCSADYDLTLHFTSDPTQNSDAANVQAYWAALNSESEEVTGYQTAAQIKTAAATTQSATMASATAKLTALGLTSAEIAAITGGSNG